VGVSGGTQEVCISHGGFRARSLLGHERVRKTRRQAGAVVRQSPRRRRWRRVCRMS
jgi:hypothetical protein